MLHETSTPLFPSSAAAVTASDSTRFAQPSAVFVGVAGTVVVLPWERATDAADSTVSFVMPAGQMVPVMCRAVYSTGTTASSMVRVF